MLKMTKDKIQDNNDEMMLDQMEELLDLASAPCANTCGNHNNVITLIKYLARMIKTAFLNQAEIKELLAEVREQQKEIIRMRKIALWGITVIGGAVLVKFGTAIWATAIAWLGF